MTDDFAAQLIAGWDEYTSCRECPQQLCMAYFIRHIKQHRPNKMSSDTEHSEDFDATLKEKINPPKPYIDAQRQMEDESASEVAQSTRGEVDKDQIRKLYMQGHSAARVRQMLNLDISIDRIYTIVRRP